MQDAMVNYCRVAYAAQAHHHEAARRRGNQVVLGTTAPSDTFKCKGEGPNDYCYIYATRAHNAHWERLLKVIGREDALDDPRFATAQSRCDHIDEVNGLIEPWVAERDKREVMETLGRAGVPAGAVFDTMELSNDPTMREREIFVTVQHPDRGAGGG